MNIPNLVVPNKLRKLENFSRVATKEYPRQTQRVAPLSQSIDVSAGKESPGRVTTTDTSRMDNLLNKITDSFPNQERMTTISQIDNARLSDKLNISTVPGTQHPALLYSPRHSMQSGAPSFDKRKSQQMERFLKSSIPQARRGLSIIG